MTQRDTVAVDRNVHDFYKDLTVGSEPAANPFRSMKDVFMWAVVLGVRIGERRPLRRRETIFRWAQFNPQVDIPILKAVALADQGDVGVLGSQESLLTVAEEYANAGIHELYAALRKDGRALWNLLSMLPTARGPE